MRPAAHLLPQVRLPAPLRALAAGALATGPSNLQQLLALLWQALCLLPRLVGHFCCRQRWDCCRRRSTWGCRCGCHYCCWWWCACTVPRSSSDGRELLLPALLGCCSCHGHTIPGSAVVLGPLRHAGSSLQLAATLLLQLMLAGAQLLPGIRGLQQQLLQRLAAQCKLPFARLQGAGPH